MFCKWCGKKIMNNGVPCPSCGKAQDALENGNVFWDLCNNKPEETASFPNDDVVLGKEIGEMVADYKRWKSLFKLLHIAPICLILLVIVIVSIGISKTGDCFSELAAIRSDISSLNERVNSGFEEIAEYHIAISNLVETQSSDDTDGLVEDNVIYIDELLENNEVLLSKTDKLSIESHKLASEPVYTVYIVSGELLSEKNIEIFWQKSIDAGDTWQTISGAPLYLVTEHSKDTIYRMLCLMDSDNASKRICYYVLPVDSVVETGSSNDETVATASETDTEDTIPNDNSKNAVG